MKHLGIVCCLLFFVGCSQEAPPEPQENLNPSEMTEADKTAEVQRLLDTIGAKLPDNWEEMTKQERGAFLLPVLMQVDVVPE